jgi:predicted Zn-dependent protease with MMP-like domain
MRIGRGAFERLVQEALEQLPEEFAELLDNVAVVVEEEPTVEELEDLGLEPGVDELFGLYHGVPLAERESDYWALPDRIVIYRGPILRACHQPRDVIDEVKDTVIHELGHHFGLVDDDMPF